MASNPKLLAAAARLQANELLPIIIKEREQDLIQSWRGSNTIEQRETAWRALRELDILAGAIDDGISKYSAG